MKRGIAIVFLFLLLVMSVSALPVEQVRLTDYVNDYTNTLSAQDTEVLRQMANALRQQGAAEVAIVFVDNFNGLTKEQYAIEVAHEKLGDTQEDNGLLILVGLEPKEYRIEVGYGLEGDLNDAKVGRFARELMVPSFQVGNYGEGVVLFMDAVQQELLAEGDLTAIPYEQPTSGGVPSIVGYAFFFIIWMIFRAISYARYRKKHNKDPDNRDIDDAFNAAFIASLFLRGGGRGGMGGGGFGGFGGGGFGGGGAGGGW